MISKSYLLHDFICGAAIDAIIPTPLPLSQGSLLEILFCTASGKGNREHCCLRRRNCLFRQLINFLVTQVPYMGSNPTQPDVMSIVQRVLMYLAIGLLDFWFNRAFSLDWLSLQIFTLFWWFWAYLTASWRAISSDWNIEFFGESRPCHCAISSCCSPKTFITAWLRVTSA
ncbi:hypothetical protein AVEN_81245-1 [Araneus ventricosus]|uniref:Uncharacterized protein n=1 Tax=Araneus ventricosus TaxID=182803 RepID=A0A4Y2SVK9_ARAVE|nr:hypothetical protein AVEN_81245-1 [Araneus ventricosus]